MKIKKTKKKTHINDIVLTFSFCTILNSSLWLGTIIYNSKQLCRVYSSSGVYSRAKVRDLTVLNCKFGFSALSCVMYC